MITWILESIGVYGVAAGYLLVPAFLLLIAFRLDHSGYRWGAFFSILIYFLFLGVMMPVGAMRLFPDEWLAVFPSLDYSGLSFDRSDAVRAVCGALGLCGLFLYLKFAGFIHKLSGLMSIVFRPEPTQYVRDSVGPRMRRIRRVLATPYIPAKTRSQAWILSGAKLRATGYLGLFGLLLALAPSLDYSGFYFELIDVLLVGWSVFFFAFWFLLPSTPLLAIPAFFFVIMLVFSDALVRWFGLFIFLLFGYLYGLSISGAPSESVLWIVGLFGYGSDEVPGVTAIMLAILSAMAALWGLMSFLKFCTPLQHHSFFWWDEVLGPAERCVGAFGVLVFLFFSYSIWLQQNHPSAEENTLGNVPGGKLSFLESITIGSHNAAGKVSDNPWDRSLYRDSSSWWEEEHRDNIKGRSNYIRNDRAAVNEHSSELEAVNRYLLEEIEKFSAQAAIQFPGAHNMSGIGEGWCAAYDWWSPFDSAYAEMHQLSRVIRWPNRGSMYSYEAHVALNRLGISMDDFPYRSMSSVYMATSPVQGMSSTYKYSDGLVLLQKVPHPLLRAYSGALRKKEQKEFKARWERSLKRQWGKMPWFCGRLKSVHLRDEWLNLDDKPKVKGVAADLSYLHKYADKLSINEYGMETFRTPRPGYSGIMAHHASKVAYRDHLSAESNALIKKRFRVYLEFEAKRATAQADKDVLAFKESIKLSHLSEYGLEQERKRSIASSKKRKRYITYPIR